MSHAFIAALAVCAVVSDAAIVTAPGPDGSTLTIEVASASSFRLGVRFGGWGVDALASPMLDPARARAPSSPVTWPVGGFTGLQTSFGALLVSTDGSGAWVLVDASNKTLVSSDGPPALVAGGPGRDDGIALPVAGPSAFDGPDRPCLSNGDFGPPYYYNRDAAFFAFAVSSNDFDPAFPHCYPVSFSGNMGSGPTPREGVPKCTPVRNNTIAVKPVRSNLYPHGGKATLAGCCALCEGDPSCTAYQWSVINETSATGNCWPLASYSGTDVGATYTLAGAPPLPPPTRLPAWWAMGTAADWYVAPTAVPLAFTRALYDLTGAPAVPPRHAWGFMATYWGYTTMEEVEGNMTAFRDGAYPVSTFIMDYDFWNTPENPNLDFGYDPKMFGNHTFIHAPNSTVPNATTSGPAELFEHFKRDLNMRWAGIRKPRTYSNQALSNASGWLLPDIFSVGAGDYNWNMSAPGWADWYTTNHLHFLEDGVEFWWCDEGETQWLTYLWWGDAQAAMFAAVRPGERMTSLNRAFQPGMQRNAAITWTGDRQDCRHATVLHFTTSGQPYTACDMTAPDATVLVRQYQNAVFLPIMRTHAMHGVPRFPYLWGGDAHHAAFRAALNLRYAFIPFLYSLGHRLHATGAPIALPASYIFPTSPDFPTSLGDATYMVGDVLLPADLSFETATENSTTVNVPPGIWFTFNSTSAVAGPLTALTRDDVPLEETVLLVRAGAILTLQRDVVQHTDALGGALAVHVYAGADGAFELVEDDGHSFAYQTGAVRRTAFAYSDASRTLSWTVTGPFPGDANSYSTMWPVLFVANATAPVAHGPITIGSGGSVAL